MESNVSIIKKLIQTCKDAEKSYLDAAEHVEGAALKTLFQEQSSERERFARELRAGLATMSELITTESGSISAAIHRAWTDLKANLHSDERSILVSVEQGEDTAREAYDEALKAPLTGKILRLVQQQAQSIRFAHDKAKSLLDACA